MRGAFALEARELESLSGLLEELAEIDALEGEPSSDPDAEDGPQAPAVPAGLAIHELDPALERIDAMSPVFDVDLSLSDLVAVRERAVLGQDDS